MLPLSKGAASALWRDHSELRWSDKFKVGHIDWYDGSSNPKEFIQVYQTVIEATGGDDQVKANFLPTTVRCGQIAIHQFA
jgi:hypothetical protein